LSRSSRAANGVDAGERRSIERGVSLGAKRRDAERDRNALRERRDQAHAFVDVLVRLVGQAEHEIELEPFHLVRSGKLGGPVRVSYAGPSLERFANAFARAVHGCGERS